MPDIWASKSLASTLQVVYPVIGYCCSQTVPSLVTIRLLNCPVIGYYSALKLSHHWLLFGSQTVPWLVTIWHLNWPVIGWRSPDPEDECPGGQQKEHNIGSCKKRPFTSTPCDYLRKKSERIILFWQKRTFIWVMRKWGEEEEMREYIFWRSSYRMTFRHFYNLIS